MSVNLTVEECRALHELICDLSGGSPENVFLEIPKDEDALTPLLAACAKVYHAAGKYVPPRLLEAVLKNL